MPVRLLRTLLVFAIGVQAGSAAAAAFARRALRSRGDEESDELDLVAVFDGIELTSRATTFRGGSLLAWYGGISVDLRDTELAPGARLSVTTLFGGITVRIPAGWRVESGVRALAGGVDVRALPGDDPGAPTLTLDGIALFGGVSVAARPSER